MSGRLNSFQRTILQWNDLHPYNAVHVVRVPAALDLERVRCVLAEVLQAWGLTGWHVDRSRGTFRYRKETISPAVLTAVDEGPPREQLERLIERQLNTPFQLEANADPFRFFVVPDGDAFFLGLVYFHVIADAESVVRLLKEIVEVLLGEAVLRSDRAIELYPPPCDRLLRARPRVLLRTLLALPAQVREMRRAYRPSYQDPADMSNRFLLLALGPEELEAMVLTAKRLRATVHDLLLALLMKSLAGVATDRFSGRRRRRLAVGSIVNIRRDLGEEGEGTFGLRLGSFVVSHEVPEEVDLLELTQSIQEQTARIKRGQLYLAMPAQLAFARWVFRFFSTDRRRKFYQKHHPLWAGITNMNLNSVWPEMPGHRPVEYFRAVSTGPVTPFVLSTTTLGQRLHMGLSYRSTVFSAEQVKHVKEQLEGMVHHLCSTRS